MRDFFGYVLSVVAEALYSVGDWLFGYRPEERF